MLVSGTKLAARSRYKEMPISERSVQPESVVTNMTSPTPADAPGINAAADLAALRQLMLGPLLEQQSDLEQRLEDIARQQEAIAKRQSELNQRRTDCSEVLAQSLDTLHEQGQNLNRQLEGEVFAGVQKSFQNETERMAELMYPILGPAVRKLVASLFQRSETNSGKPYQVEQLFLIHKETSILLSQAVLDEDAARDADLVSGMLEAIRSFVKDAFSLHEFDGMNSINLGDLTVWVEWGPKAVLAVVIRGFPDESLREDYADVLQLIHRQFAGELESFDGDVSVFDTLNIATLNQNHDAPVHKRTTVKDWITPPRFCAAAALLTMFVVAGVVSDNREWNGMMAKLTSEPGIVVVNAQRSWRNNNLTILHDPLAAPKNQIVRRSGIDLDKTRIQWHSFQSHDTKIVQRRESRQRLFTHSTRTPRATNQRTNAVTDH